MSTPATKLMTAEEFYDFCHRFENKDRHFELERGEIVEMSLPGKRHGVVCGNANGIMWVFTKQTRKGYVCANDTGLVLERDPDTVRGADVAWYEESPRYQDPPLKYDEHLPALAIEVLSPTGRMNKMLRRIDLFMEKGVKLVWLLQPELRNLTVYRQGREPLVLSTEDEVTGEDVLPGFRCKVAEFFATTGK